MEYFRLEQDKRIPNAVLMQGLPEIYNYNQARAGNISALEFVTVTTVQHNLWNYYPDVLDRQLFMIKENVKKVFSLYLPKLEYRIISLYDMETKSVEEYYIPILEIVDCLSPESDWNLDRSVVRRAVLSPNTLTVGQSIVQASNVRDRMIIVSLEVAESLLRRKLNGIRLIHIPIQ